MKHFSGLSNYADWPVVGLHDEYRAGYWDPLHSHDRAQLLYASSGVMSVIVDRANYVVPPQRAVWIPPNMLHEVRCRSQVSLRTLYVDQVKAGMMRQDSHVIEISDFLRALILEIARVEDRDDRGVREQRISDLILDELRQMPKAPFQAPLPEDFRLSRVCREILANPADKRSLDELAAVAGMGRRTFTRLFKEQTGMGVAAWRQQIRLMEGISMLSTGKPVTSVAYDVGYGSPSAFTAIFHRSFGVPPSDYLPRNMATSQARPTFNWATPDPRAGLGDLKTDRIQTQTLKRPQRSVIRAKRAGCPQHSTTRGRSPHAPGRSK